MTTVDRASKTHTSLSVFAPFYYFGTRVTKCSAHANQGSPREDAVPPSGDAMLAEGLLLLIDDDLRRASHARQQQRAIAHRPELGLVQVGGKGRGTRDDLEVAALARLQPLAKLFVSETQHEAREGRQK